MESAWKMPNLGFMQAPRDDHGKAINQLLAAEVLHELSEALRPSAARAQRLKTVVNWGAGVPAVVGSSLLAASFARNIDAPVGTIGLALLLLAFGAFVIGDRIWKKNLLGLATRGLPPRTMPEQARRFLDDLQSGDVTAWLEPSVGGAARRMQFGPLLFRAPFGPLSLSPESRVQALARGPWASGETSEFRFRPSETSHWDGWGNEAASSAPIELHVMEPLASTEAAAPEGPFNPYLLRPIDQLKALLETAYPGHDTASARHKSRLIGSTFLIASELLARRHFAEVTELRNAVISGLQQLGFDNYGLSESEESVSSSWMDKALSRNGYPSIQRKLEAAEAAIGAKGPSASKAD